jgi:penicillin-binding protein 2
MVIQRQPRLVQPATARKRRGVWAKVLVMILVGFLGYSLVRVQIMGAEQYALQAKENRMRPLVVRAPRGTIYDRHGRVVAENMVGYQVLLMPAPLDSLRKQATSLQPILGMTDGEVELAFRRYRRQPHLPLELHRDAPFDGIMRLEERRLAFPNALVYEYPKRRYPEGPSIAHFIGYVSEISEPELQLEEFQGYRQGRWIGKAGLERQYEKWLGGEPGMRYLEIDARGRIKRWMPEDMGVPPIPGRDLHLYLDLDLQRFVAEIFPPDRTGAIIAMDPKTGGILAYYSHPTFDPNEFIGGIPADYWRQLNEDPKKPLLDRVSTSGQPAASTWKLAMAGMALDVGAVRPDEYMPISCTGGVALLGRYARCWYAAGHGRQNLIEGIKNSCNVYFYQLGVRIGFERMLREGARLGFDRKTGIDIPHEIANTYPTDTGFWVRRFRYRPNDNEVLSMVIGQGPVTMTALKLAHIYTALASPNGRVPAPRFAMNMGEPADTFEFRLTPEQQWYLETGMRRVVAPGGTAALSRLRDWDFFGKTGTAQNPHGPSHGWFVGMGGPRDGRPEIAVTMFIEFAESGAMASGYVAESINFYLDRKYGRPFQRFATPRLRMPAGLPVDYSWLWSPLEEPPMPRGQ